MAVACRVYEGRHMLAQLVGGHDRAAPVGVDAKPGEDGLVERAACSSACALVELFGLGEQLTQFLDDGLPGGQVYVGGTELFLKPDFSSVICRILRLSLSWGQSGWPTRSRYASSCFFQVGKPFGELPAYLSLGAVPVCQGGLASGLDDRADVVG